MTLTGAALCFLARPASGQWADQDWNANQNGMSAFDFHHVSSGQLDNLAGSGDRCVKADSTGKLLPATADCNSGGSVTLGASTIPFGQTGLNITGPPTAPVLSGMVFSADCGDPSASSDDRPAFDAAVAACPSTGCIVQLRPGVYHFKSAASITKSGIHVKGYGPFATRIVVDDSTGNIGDAIVFTSTYDDSIEDLSFDSASQRTAGSYVTVAGGNPSIAVLPTFGITATYFHMVDVDMNNFYNGFVIKDSGAHNGAWGVYTTRGFFTNPAAGGTAFLLSSQGETNGYPNGASWFIKDPWIFGYSTPLANTTGVNVTGTSDFTLDNVETWGLTNGLLINPVGGMAVYSGHIQNCFFDFSQGDVAVITEARGGLVRWIDIDHTWIAGSATGDGLSVLGAADLQVSGSSRFYANFNHGVLLNQTLRSSINDSQFSLNTGLDLQVVGNAQYVTVGGNSLNSPGVYGVEIDSGTTHVAVVGNNASGGLGIVNNGTDSIANMNTGALISFGVPQNPDPNQQAIYLTLSNPGFPTNAYSMSQLPDGIVETTTTGGVSTLATLLLTATPPLYTTTTGISSPDPTGNVLWFDAGVGVGRTGTTVNSWADQSGAGNNVISVSQPPFYVASGLSGLPAISFNSGLLQNTTSNVLSSGHDRHIFAVVAAGPLAGGGTFTTGGVILAFRNTVNQFQMILGQAFGLTDVYSTGSVGDSLTSPPAVAMTPYLVEIDGQSGSPPVVYLNGTNYAVSAGTNVVSETGSTGFTVGNTLTATTQYFYGNISEIYVVDHLLTTGPELQRDRGYFAHKYNLTIAGAGGNVIDYSLQGGIVSGSTSTTPQSLGSISTAPLVCSTSAGICTVTGGTVGGGLLFNPGTGATTMGSFTCSAGQAVNASSTGGLACGSFQAPISPTTCGANTFGTSVSSAGALTCTQPAFTDVSGSLACGQLPALTGTDGIASTAGTCTVTNSFKGKVLVTGSDTTPDFLGNKVTSPTGTVAISTPSVGTMLGLDVAVGAGIRMLNFDFFGLSAGSGWLVTGNDSTVKTFGGFAVEYPLGGAFTTSRLRCINGLNTGTGYTSMSLTVTRNGSPTSAAVTIPASSATVAFDSGAISVSTGAVTDKYGLELTYNGATVPAGITDFTCSAAFQ